MLFPFTEAERAQQTALYREYDVKFRELTHVMEEIEAGNRPDTDLLFAGLMPDLDPEEWERAVDRKNDIIRDWKNQLPTEWTQKREEWWEVTERYFDMRRFYFEDAEKRYFESLGGDKDAILADAKRQVDVILQVPPTLNELDIAEEDWELEYLFIIASNVGLLSSRSDVFFTRRNMRRHLRRHFDALKRDKKRTSELERYIIAALENSAFFGGDLLHSTSLSDALTPPPTDFIRTYYPKKYITPVDRVSTLAFMGGLSADELHEISVEKRGSRRQITALVSVDFEGLKDDVKIQGKLELTAYDREVHDAIITLFVDGGNVYITPQMIYQTMTGNPNAYLNPKQQVAISDSMTKCLYSRVIIDADEEARMYGFDSFRYDGALISGERVTAVLNGAAIECLHLLRKPVLYDYAEKKNQIGRFDIKLLNSPINKNEESIMLQGYLFRRILSMKNNENLSRVIVYETVFGQMGYEEIDRKKKMSIRKKARDILDFWMHEGFILDFEEVSRKTEVYSLSIII